MSTLASFFQGSDTHLGTFYPTHYLLAVYPTLRDAENARNQLISSGVQSEEVIAVSGADMLKLSEEHVWRDGLHGMLMRKLSRVFDTEVPYTDHDLKLAEMGAGFLAVHCVDEPVKKQVWSRLKSTEPWMARYYSPSGLEHLAGEA